MRRLTRHTFALCSAVSLLLSVAVCVLWVRSHTGRELRIPLTGDHPAEAWAVPRCYILVRAGGLTVHWQRLLAGPNAAIMWAAMPDGQEVEPMAADRWDAAGFHWQRGKMFDGYWRLTVPCWFAAACAAALPTLMSRRFWRHRVRTRRGLCLNCGYDLRASPGRCPECGAPAPAAPPRHGPSQTRAAGDILQGPHALDSARL